jgi:hypothetical protein
VIERIESRMPLADMAHRRGRRLAQLIAEPLFFLESLPVQKIVKRSFDR